MLGRIWRSESCATTARLISTRLIHGKISRKSLPSLSKGSFKGESLKLRSGSHYIKSLDDAIVLFDEMVRSRSMYSAIDFNKVIGVFVRTERPDVAISLYRKMEMRRSPCDIYSFNILMKCFCSCHKFSFALSTFGIQLYDKLMTAIRLLVSEDQCEGRFVFGRKALSPTTTKKLKVVGTQLQNSGGDNEKNQLQTLLARAGHGSPVYKTRQLKNNQFRSMVTFNGLDFMGKPCGSKKNAEKDAAHEALLWLQGESKSSLNDLNHMSMLLKKNKSKKPARASSAKWG